MSKETRGKDGKFTGSIGTGKTHVPTASDSRTPHGSGAADTGNTSGGGDLTSTYNTYLSLVNDNDSGSGNQCPACGQFSGDGHTCPPEKLREYAVAEDTATAELYNERFLVLAKLESAEEMVRHTAGQERRYGSRYENNRYEGTVNDAIETLNTAIAEAEAAGNRSIDVPGSRRYASVTDAKNTLAKYDALLAENRRLLGLIDEANERYRPFRWNRAFLVVTNGTGHVHSSMGCSTCYPTTRFVWLPQYSGGTEDQIVADAGERACTICYSSAPSEYRSRPTQIYSDEERAAFAAREERAAAREVREAARIQKAATKDGSELVVVTERGIQPAHMRNAGQPYARKEHFKTERSAVSWATDRLAGFYRTPTETEQEAIQQIAASLAEKRDCPVEDVMAELNAKAEAKRRRNR